MRVAKCQSSYCDDDMIVVWIVAHITPGNVGPIISQQSSAFRELNI